MPAQIVIGTVLGPVRIEPVTALIADDTLPLVHTVPAVVSMKSEASGPLAWPWTPMAAKVPSFVTFAVVMLIALLTAVRPIELP